MSIKSFLLSFIFLLVWAAPPAMAQYDPDPLENNCEDFYETEYKYNTPHISTDNKLKQIIDWCRQKNVADKLQAGVSLSTMGLGLEIKTPVTRWVSLRLGVDWLPSIKVPMQFDLNTFADGVPTGSFSRVQEMLYEMTGIQMDETVIMKGRASMTNFKFMADVYPFQNNRHWHITAGFYAGTSKLADAINDYGEKPTLVGLNIYNRAYEYFTTLTDIFNVPLGGGAYLDPDLVEKLQERFLEYGRMGIQIGYFKDGTPYLMQPAPDGSISAKAFVNHFKPYFGVGYSTHLDSGGKFLFSIDAGAILWGGAPKVINHDWAEGRDINFTKDLVDIRGKVGTYIGIVKALPVYPSLAIRFSYNIF